MYNVCGCLDWLPPLFPCSLTLTVLYKPIMLSFSRLFIPLVYLIITIPSLVHSHELTFKRRHGSKRFRSLPDLPVVNLPSANSQSATSIDSQSTVSDTSPTAVRVFICSLQRLGFDLVAPQTSSLASSSASSAISTSTGAASTVTSSQSTSSIASSSTSSSASSSIATTASSSSTLATPQTSADINLTPITLIPTANVVASTITSTQSLSVIASSTATPQTQSASTKTKSTTLTVLIAVAASVGGIAILWTIFRKWKLSSSKEFDRRLNPITDWQPTSGEDDLISSLRRAPSSSSSFHSGGGGSGDGHLDHDFTAGPGNTAPIGGYADLARASSTNPPMQQTLGRGPSFNHGYDVGVPLHHQTGYGIHDAYDYNGGSARY